MGKSHAVAPFVSRLSIDSCAVTEPPLRRYWMDHRASLGVRSPKRSDEKNGRIRPCVTPRKSCKLSANCIASWASVSTTMRLSNCSHAGSMIRVSSSRVGSKRISTIPSMTRSGASSRRSMNIARDWRRSSRRISFPRKTRLVNAERSLKRQGDEEGARGHSDRRQEDRGGDDEIDRSTPGAS